MSQKKKISILPQRIVYFLYIIFIQFEPNFPFVWVEDAIRFPCQFLSNITNSFDIQFYIISILFIIPDPEVTFSFPRAVPPNKIDPFGSWSMMAFLLNTAKLLLKIETISIIQIDY